MVVRGANYPRHKNDFYETPPETTRALLDAIGFRDCVCDPAAGRGAILKVLEEYDYTALGDDIDRGYDFLTKPFPRRWKNSDIVTNPPFGVGGRLAVKFIVRALEVTLPWHGRVAMLLPVDFDSAKTRRHLFADCRAFQLKLVLLNRIRWFNDQSGSVNHAWYIWNHTNKDGQRIDYAEQVYPETVECLR